MKLLNTQPITLPDDEESSRRRTILSETLETEEPRIKRFIRVSLFKLKIFYSPEEIEERTDEIYQLTAQRALEKAEDFDETRSAYSYLNGFAANLIKQTQDRVLKRRTKFDDDFEDLERIENLRRKIETTALPEESFWEILEHSEDVKFRFERLITPLNKQYQEILRLHYLEELNIVEIAAQLGKSEGAAQRQLNRAETKLREMLSRRRGN
ncbi:hypothetical protein BH20ACI1_BH20ACI1_12430 [soil metagenome]